jgi:putative peptide zinc metalloprotease protein
VSREAAVCGVCGRVLRPGAAAPLELVLPDGSRVPIEPELTIGRAAGNTVRLDDPSVSRHHARIHVVGAEAVLEDVGSTYGTFLGEERLSGTAVVGDGATFRVGETPLSVERRRSEAEPGRTVLLRVAPARPAQAGVGEPVTARPRLRADCSLKRLDVAEGEQRFVLRDARTDAYLRMSAPQASLVPLLDGRRTIAELVAVADERLGGSGAAILAGLLASLGDHGLLAGVEERAPAPAPGGRLRRLFTPRVVFSRRAAATVDRIYERGGFVLFTRPGLAISAALAAAGAVAFVYLIVGRYGTPFVVARKVGIGGLVFVAGRFVIATAHELAHALCLAAFGRRVGAVGLKRIAIFPYAFAETTEAWFEPRRRRIAVSAAGPASDLVIAGTAALAAAALSPSTLRDIVFQLALGGYVGAFFNLNPLLDRDGYAILVDALGEPGLRRRGREQMVAVLAGASGRDSRTTSRSATLYGFATVAWSFIGIGIATVFSLRYYDTVEALVGSRALTTALFAVGVGAVLAPLVYAVLRPVLSRPRGRVTEES